MAEAILASRPWRWAIATTLVLVALRLWLAERVGFADAEALYACYAMHPQPAYLDHPGLVGAVMRLIGGDGAPNPVTTHRVTALAATAFPWCGALAARATGAPWTGALRTYFALACVPELAIGLFAMNPDLLLGAFWLGALGSAGAALRAPPGSTRALFGFLAAGACAAFATLSKATGALLGLSLLATLASPVGRPHVKTAAPWLGLLLGSVLLAPLVVWEHAEGYSMLRHRLVGTQSEAGFSLRNVGALVGGQLAYVTPPFLIAAWHVFTRLPRAGVAQLLRTSTLLPAAFLVPLCLWSRVAEPHWVAPAYLALALGAAHTPPMSRVIRASAIGIGIAAVALSAVWVGTPVMPKLLGRHYRPRYDLANDLYAWAPVTADLRDAVGRIRHDTGANPVVVGPFWTLCAQAHAALGPDVLVGCRTPIGDDFARWMPAPTWHDAPVVLFVHDDRRPYDPAAEFPNRAVVEQKQIQVHRDGVLVRTVTVTRLDRVEDVARSR